MKKTTRTWISILALLSLVYGSIALWSQCYKITKLSLHMAALKDNAMYYEEGTQKTDAGYAFYWENDAKRQSLYHSSDDTTRVFSNLPLAVKILGAIVCTLGIGAIPWAWYRVIKAMVKEQRKARQRRNRQTRKAQMRRL